MPSAPITSSHRDPGRALREDVVQVAAMQRDRRRDVAPEAGFVEVDERPPALVGQAAPLDNRPVRPDGIAEPQPI